MRLNLAILCKVTACVYARFFHGVPTGSKVQLQNRTEQNKTFIFYISQATIWHMRLITYILTFYFKVQVWRNIISMVTMLSIVLIFGTSNMGYIFSYMLLFVEK